MEWKLEFLGRRFEGYSLIFLVMGILDLMVGGHILVFLGFWFAWYYSVPTKLSTHEMYLPYAIILLTIIAALNFVGDVKSAYQRPVMIAKTSETVTFRVTVEKSDLENNPYVHLYLPMDGEMYLEESEYAYSYHQDFTSHSFPVLRLFQVDTGSGVRHFSEKIWDEGDHFFDVLRDLDRSSFVLYRYSDGRYLMVQIPYNIRKLQDKDLLGGKLTFEVTGFVYKKEFRDIYTWIAELVMK